MNFFRTTALAACAFAMTGCASIVNGSNQSLSVETRLDNAPFALANCKLSNDKGSWFLTSPGSTTVHRSFQDLVVQCDRDGAVGAATFKSSTKAMAFGNILFGGVIGAGVDVATGAAYDYPVLLTVDLIKEAAPAVAPTSAPAASATPAPAAAAVAAVSTAPKTAP